MSLRSRLCIAVAAGALAVTALGTPAVAADDREDSGGDWGNQQIQNGQSQDQFQSQVQDPGHHQNHNPRLYKGVVTASSLALRSAPNRGGQIIRWAGKGDVVTIFCKAGGQNIQGNSTWYLLTDGTWAWGSARYIHTIGTTPRWC